MNGGVYRVSFYCFTVLLSPPLSSDEEGGRGERMVLLLLRPPPWSCGALWGRERVNDKKPSL